MGAYRYPFSPFPDGWYAVAFSSEVGRGELSPRQFMGKEVVLYRTESGEAVLADAFCPHMGAHFAHGGQVDGEVLRCPFHGFCFDSKGTCVKTAYGTKPPKKAQLPVFHLREQNGVILAFFDHAGRAPQWEPPALSEQGFSRWSSECLTFAGHPQETTENSVDTGHFSVVHGYSGIEILEDLTTEGPYLHAKYAMQRDASVLGKVGQMLRAEFEVHVHGLGYSFVDVHVPKMGLHSRHLVLATPTDGTNIELRLAVSLERLQEPGRLFPLLGLLPRGPLTSLMRRFIFRGFVHDVKQDFDIWKHKRYVTPPALAKGDGPVGSYRKWTRQFYPDLPQAVAG